MQQSDKILQWALYLAKKRGLRGFTREQVARQAGVSTGTVSNTFGGMDGLVAALVPYAVNKEAWPVVAQALAEHHPAARRLSDRVKLKALEALL